MKKIILLLVSSLFFTACNSASFNVGDDVLAEWFQNSWHKGKIVEKCGEGEKAGFNIDFEDDFYDAPEGDSEICYLSAQIIKNEAPDPADLEVNMKVLGEWVQDAFYNATITKIQENKYTLKYDDDYSQEVGIEKLRLLPKEKLQE